MTALVVYESMYGNTQAVARAIAEGIGDAQVVEVGVAPTALPADLDLLVVGGPTHVHGMSRPQTRADAGVRVDRPVVSKADGVREWTGRVRADHPILAAAFDTRVPAPELFTGSAAKGIEKSLRHQGARVMAVESFVLDGVKGGPFDRVAPAELERARAWGRALTAERSIGAMEIDRVLG